MYIQCFKNKLEKVFHFSHNGKIFILEVTGNFEAVYKSFINKKVNNNFFFEKPKVLQFLLSFFFQLQEAFPKSLSSLS